MAKLSAGNTVRLQGLKAAPELNGLIGVLDDFDEKSGRWRVSLNNGVDRVVKALKPDNLVLEEQEEKKEAGDAIEDDGTLTLVGAGTDHPKIHQFLDIMQLQIPTANKLLKTVAELGAPETGEAAKWTARSKEIQKLCITILETLQDHMQDIDNIDATVEGFGEVKMARKALIRFVQQMQEHLEPAKERVEVLLRLHGVEESDDTGSQKRKRGWDEEDEEDELKAKYAHVFAEKEQEEKMDIDENEAEKEAEEAEWKRRQEERQKREEAEEVARNIKRKAAAKRKGVEVQGMKPISVKYQGKGDPVPPNDNLYVKGLPASVTEEDIEAIFSEAGDVESVKVKTSDWGAIAFVRMEGIEQATEAIELFDDTVPLRLESLKAAKMAKLLKTAKPEVEEKKSEPQDQTLAKGKRVKIHSLKGVVVLNGQFGTLDSFDQAKGRWKVKLEKDGQIKALKAENLALEEKEATAPKKSAPMATVDGMKLLNKPIGLYLDMSKPIGMSFDKNLAVKSVEAKGQASQSKIKKGWRAHSVMGMMLKNSEQEFAKALKELKTEGIKGAVFEFLAPQFKVTFGERPFGFGVGLDESCGLFLVGEAADFAVKKGVKKGLALTKVDDTDLVGFTQEELVKCLKDAPLPVQLTFCEVPPEDESQKIKPPPDPPKPPASGKAPPPAPPQEFGMTVDEACKFFGLPITCTKEDVSKAYRKQSAPHHPDKQDKTKSEGALKFINDQFLECGKAKEVLMFHLEGKFSK